MSNAIDNLQESFAHFPGIGPRQARRIAYYLANQSHDVRKRIIHDLGMLDKDVVHCSFCERTMINQNSQNVLCSVCADNKRDNALIMVVSSTLDLEAIERTRLYNGKYYVFGPLFSLKIKDANKQQYENNRIQKLIDFLSKQVQTKEMIISFSANNEGVLTTDRIIESCKNIPTLHEQFKITILGRGISSGAEIEYIDDITLDAALKGRTSI